MGNQPVDPNAEKFTPDLLGLGFGVDRDYSIYRAFFGGCIRSTLNP